MRVSPSPAMLIAAKRALRDSSEFKFKNTAGPFYNEDNNGRNTELSAVAQGVDSDDRIANRITMTRLDVQLFAENTGGFRVIVYVPKIADDQLDNAIVYNGVDNNRFWVLHDEFYESNSGGNVAQRAVNFKINKTLKLFYSGAGATLFEKNPVKMYCATLRGGVGLGSTINGHTKLWYKDM